MLVSVLRTADEDILIRDMCVHAARCSPFGGRVESTAKIRSMIGLRCFPDFRGYSGAQ